MRNDAYAKWEFSSKERRNYKRRTKQKYGHEKHNNRKSQPKGLVSNLIKPAINMAHHMSRIKAMYYVIISNIH